MKFGIGLFTGQRRNDDHWSDVYDDMVTLTTEAESLGFDSAWVSEHHFAPDLGLATLRSIC